MQEKKAQSREKERDNTEDISAEQNRSRQNRSGQQQIKTGQHRTNDYVPTLSIPSTAYKQESTSEVRIPKQARTGDGFPSRATYFPH